MKRERVKVGIIGAGWYGCDLAVFLKRRGMDVTVLEKKDRIFSGISGNFGVRLHAGPHYPRSERTREGCRDGLVKFLDRFPNLVNRHSFSHYGLGATDADGNPPKVSAEAFRRVCEEVDGFKEVVPEEEGYKDLLMLGNVPEPSCVVGERLRKYFESLLEGEGVNVRCGVDVCFAESTQEQGVLVSINGRREYYDNVINATSFQSLLPKQDLPHQIRVFYQPCIALVYEDLRQQSNRPEALPFSTIVMDGWFPCMMPYDDRINKEGPPNKYIVTHGKWTIIGSYPTAEEASGQLEDLTDIFVRDNIKPPCESEWNRFWPEFNDTNFRYLGWKGAVLCKMKTNGEFRGAFSFQDYASKVIYVFPGKISNVFDIEQEVLSLIQERNLKKVGGYRYPLGGVLDRAQPEIRARIMQPNTCDLQTIREISPPSKGRVGKEPAIVFFIVASIFYYLSRSVRGALFFSFSVEAINHLKAIFSAPKESKKTASTFGFIAKVLLSYYLTGSIGAALLATFSAEVVNYCRSRRQPLSAALLNGPVFGKELSPEMGRQGSQTNGYK